MRWSDRLELTFNAFKRSWLPLYGWYLIFFLITALSLLVIGLVFLADVSIQGLIQGHFSFPNPVSPEVSPIPGPPVPPGIPNVPLPPGAPFDGSSTRSAFPPLYLLSRLIPVIILFIALSVIAGGAFMAGLFNLTKKAYYEKPSFGDFKFEGTFRVVGWNLLVTLFGLLVVGSGVLGAFLFSNSSLGIIFMIIYGLFVVALFIFLVPWLSSSVYYMLSQPQLSFGRALNESFTFFRRHMSKLWGYIGAAFIFMIALFVIQHFSETLGGIAQLLYTPLGGILPIVWVLSIIEEERDYENPYYVESSTYRQSQAQMDNPNITESSDPNQLTNSEVSQYERSDAKDIQELENRE